MEVNRKRLIYAILREINANNKELQYNADEFDVDADIFIEVMEIIDDEEFVKGLHIVRTLDSPPELLFQKLRITLKGIEFLENNSEWIKIYKGIKELKSWISFTK